MLRWKKLKLKNVTEEAAKRPASTVSDGSVEPSTTSAMVLENVPPSVSVGSASTPHSSSSSISSDGMHIMPPLTRLSDEETTVSGGLCAPWHLRTAQDSSNESCPSVRGIGTTIRTNISNSSASAGEKRKLELFHREASDSDISEPSGGTGSGDDSNAVVHAEKKARVASPSLSLLANAEDSEVLNPLHVFVRNQIEVFTATPKDMALPAPGRKNPIKIHQVGLRCIHCRHLPSRDRVKRAVCYPSSVGRVYHSVSDMKFDHFGNCRGTSKEIHDKFEALKTQCRRRGDQRKSGGSTSGNSSSTAQYYHDAARKMGMLDGVGGIFMAQAIGSQQPSSPVRSASPLSDLSRASTSPLRASLYGNSKQVAKQISLHPSLPPLPAQVLAMYQQMPRYTAFSLSNPAAEAPAPLVYPLLNTSTPRKLTPRLLSSPTVTGSQNRLLASPLDQQFLNPIHCFVRRNVEVFAATNEDIAAPAPGRKKRVTIGQVGIRCIHCAQLPVKDRVKRAVCYPPSVNGIYHSVSNMKFDHFGNCQGLPPESRAEFISLRASCNRRSGNGASRSGTSNLTAQYYNDSAVRLGLVDTEEGIRFREQEEMVKASSPLMDASDAAIPDGISVLMLAATNPLIRAEYNRRRQASV